MAVIKQGILGGFSGSVANITGSSWKGIAVIKSKPLSVANPQTAAQVTNRSQFASAVAFSKEVLAGAIKPLLDEIAVKMSGYNLFVQLNKDLFDADGLATPADVKISVGTLTGLANKAAHPQAGDDETIITWDDNTGTGDALGTDLVLGVLYNVTKNTAIAIPATATRADGTLTVPTPATWDDADVRYFMTAVKRTGTKKRSTGTSDLAGAVQ